MFNLENKNSSIYKKGMIINQLIVIFSIILTQAFDDTKHEIIFRVMWWLSAFMWTVLMGTKEVIANKNNAGYFYYVLAVVFAAFIIWIEFGY
ncbi:MAG: hypothetical protein N4A62_10790 [Marinisporobacter sp.]|jgi:hypothetical protein|nr:hypothetical protein [Marinisporobacter sp.]